MVSRVSSSTAVERVRLDAILAMREEYRREMDCQIVHDSWHARGFTTSFVLRLDGEIAGYGAVGGAPGDPKNLVKEFFLKPAFRGAALPLFRELIAASGARAIEAQTNDPLLLLMLLDGAVDLTSPTVLFADGLATHHAPAGTAFRPLTKRDRARVFAHTLEPVGEYGLELEGTIVATGGIMLHYNRPYADVYMEVAEPHRRKGLGAYLVQELKRLAYAEGHVPAARCGTGNVASRRTLERAGMFPCGRVVRGTIAGAPHRYGSPR